MTKIELPKEGFVAIKQYKQQPVFFFRFNTVETENETVVCDEETITRQGADHASMVAKCIGVKYNTDAQLALAAAAEIIVGNEPDLDDKQIVAADIDYNKHVNNANYVRMAMELLSADFEVKNLRLEYRIPAKLGDTLVPVVYHIGETIVVSLDIHGEASAIVEFS